MTFATAVQTYAGADVVQRDDNFQCALDWANQLIWIAWTSGAVSKSSIISGAELASALMSSYNDAPNHILTVAPPLGIDESGNIYITSGQGLSTINGSTLAIEDTWGAWSVGFFPPGLPDSTTSANALQGPLLPIRTPGGNQFVLGCGIGGLFGDLNQSYLAQLPDFAGLTFDWGDNGRGPKTCNGPANAGYGWLATSRTTTNILLITKITCLDGGAWVPADWPTLNPEMSATTLAGFAPTDIDAGWTTIECSGICLDKSDNNLLVVMRGQGFAPNQNYLVKVDATTGTIIWQSVIDDFGFNPGQQLGMSDISNHRICFILYGTTNTVLTISTFDGSSTTYNTGLAGIGAASSPSQCFSDALGAIFLNGQFNVVADGPTPLNGSAGGFTGWMALYVGDASVPAVSGEWFALMGPVRPRA